MRKAGRTNGSADQVKAVERAKESELFFASIRDQLELLKGVALSLAILAAPQVVLESNLAVYNKVIGATACVMLGFWTLYCAIALYFQHRLKIRGLPRRIQIARIGQYVVVCIAGFFAGDLALQARGKVAAFERRSGVSAASDSGRTVSIAPSLAIDSQPAQSTLRSTLEECAWLGSGTEPRGRENSPQIDTLTEASI